MNPPGRTVAAVVPAAGASRRFGGVKLVADLHGQPLLQHTLRCLVDAGVPRVVVVAAPDADLASVPALHDSRVTLVRNPEPERGMFSSVQTGLAAIDDGASVLVLPADMPFVRPSTVAELVAAHARDGAARVATHAGRRGHPIVIPADVRTALLTESPTISLKDALANLGVVMRELQVDDPGVLRDVDVRSDLP